LAMKAAVLKQSNCKNTSHTYHKY